MEERLLSFIIWTIIGLAFLIMGIYILNSKKTVPFGFWANTNTAPIENVTSYNRALGILWCVYGILFILIGTPLLFEQIPGLIIIPILGTVFITIVAMIVYVIAIEGRYRKK